MAKAKTKKISKKILEMEKNKSLFMIVVVLIVLLGIVAISYAWLTQTITSSNDNVIVAGNLQLTLGNESPILKIGGDYGYGVPVTDAAGLQSDPYTFTVTNTGTVNAKYNLFLDDVTTFTDANSQSVTITSATRISDTKLNYNLRVGSTDSNEAKATLSTLSNPRRIVTSETLTPGQSKTYYLRIWIDKDATSADVEGKYFAAKLRIEATQTENPTIPNS